MCDLDLEFLHQIKDAYIKIHGSWAFDEEHCCNSFVSAFEDKDTLEEYIIDSYLEGIDIPDALTYYIDYDSILKDRLIDSYIYDELEGTYYLFLRI